MAQSLTKEERDAINRMSLFFGQSFSLTREFFESLYIFSVFEHINDREVLLPFLGSLKVASPKDEILPEGRVAQLRCSFKPSINLRKNIGQLKDGEITDAERLLLDRIISIFSVNDEPEAQGE